MEEDQAEHKDCLPSQLFNVTPIMKKLSSLPAKTNKTQQTTDKLRRTKIDPKRSVQDSARPPPRNITQQKPPIMDAHRTATPNLPEAYQ